MAVYRIIVEGYTDREIDASSEQEARERIRREMHVKRLPNYTEVTRVDMRKQRNNDRKRMEFNERVNKDVLDDNPWLSSTDL
jgi:hypothetical protein